MVPLYSYATVNEVKYIFQGIKANLMLILFLYLSCEILMMPRFGMIRILELIKLHSFNYT